MKFVVKPASKYELAFCNGCSHTNCAKYKQSCGAKGIKVNVSVK